MFVAREILTLIKEKYSLTCTTNTIDEDVFFRGSQLDSNSLDLKNALLA